MKRLTKFIKIITNFRSLYILMRFHVAAGVEHDRILRGLNCRIVVDVGANRGQFALLVLALYPDVQIFSFEPLSGPARVFSKVFAGNNHVRLYQVALGAEESCASMHVSAHDDSSSLLRIGEIQNKIFPGTYEVGTEPVQVRRLDKILNPATIIPPALLKIDVQGYEIEALRGCESLLCFFAWVYCECSFIPLYDGQALADDVIAWLRERGFKLTGVYNMAYDARGKAVQADFLFVNLKLDARSAEKETSS